MKKLNLVCAAVVALCATVANAGTLTGSTTFAVENFSGTYTGTVAIKPITYSMGTSTTLNPNAALYFIIRLNGATFNGGASVLATTFSIGGVTAGATPTGATPGVVASVSADGSTMQVAVTNGNATTTLGLGALVWNPAANAALSAVNSTLGTAGGQVTATVVVSTTAMGTGTALNSTVALPATVDGSAPTTAIATSKAAITASVSDLSDETNAYTNQIDLTASPAGSDYTSTGNIVLGSVKLKNASGSPLATDAATAYTVAAKVSSAKVTVTPGAGQSFAVGSNLFYDVDTSCTNSPAGTVAVTSANATKALTLSVTSVTANSPVYVCMSKPGTVSNVQQVATPITATLAVTTVPTNNVDGSDTASGLGYAVNYNGKSVTLNSYFPAAINQFGYTPFVRIINTGAVAADISAAIVDGTTGATGTGGVVAAGLKPGAAVLVTNASIEAVIGAQPRDSRPRLKISGPTNGLRVQNFLQNADGSISELSGAQDGQ